MPYMKFKEKELFFFIFTVYFKPHYLIVSWALDRIVVCVGGVKIPLLEQNRFDLGG